MAQGLETYHRRTSDEKLMDSSEFDSLVSTISESCPEEHAKWLSGRLMHGNEINLGKRLKRIIDPFKDKLGSSKDRGKLLRKIVDTRNYLTHYSENLKDNAAGGEELWNLYQKMEVIFQLHFLKVLGFNDEEIESVVENSYPLKQKIDKI
ncbi:HEPN domain-containing protein [Colwellia sp. E2M01]|uniref:HEPN domain-containing protein n=1 Tax=Colwellia sp. E2M01 TaxID=2841561 RepID=UPI0025B0A6CC|nr:HEPN domain-containing protein [Colwellia sp. E2M01]